MTKDVTIQFEEDEWRLIETASNGGSVKEWMLEVASSLLDGDVLA